MNLRTSIRRSRAGFLFVVVLLSAAAGSTLWTGVRSSHQVDALVQEALARATLIGDIRLEAVSLESAVEAHVRAPDAAERAAADEQMGRALQRVREGTEAYTRNLPPGEKLVWQRFDAACHALARQVREAVTYSKRREAERARQHLAEQIRPRVAELDALAAGLARENAEEAHELLGTLESLRSRNTALSALLVLLAIALSLAVGSSVSHVLQRQEATIHAQLQELGRRNRELDAFASRVAHDLMGPLSPLKGYLTLIRRSGEVREPGTLEMLSHAEASASRMRELIEALLRFCRAGRRGEGAQGALDTAVSTSLLEVGQTAGAQGVQLERQLEQGLLVPCPGQLLQCVAHNLLSNAVKYSAGRPGARVQVRVAREGGEALLEVNDNGIGMSEQVQASLFQPFFRAPEARGVPGHGLGLATARRLVEAHGGSLSVRSAPGQGTRVHVRLPLLAVPPPAAAGLAPSASPGAHG